MSRARARIRKRSLVHLLNRDERRLGVERVEDGLDHQEVGAAVDQAPDLLDVRLAHLVERRRAEPCVVDVGGNREGPVHRPHDARGKARLFRRPGRPLVARGPGQARALEVQLVGERLEPVVRLHDRGAVERVRLEDVAAGLEVLVMDPADDVRPRQHEQIVVALEILRVVEEALAPEVPFGEPLALDHRAHRAVENQDPARQQVVEPSPETSLRVFASSWLHLVLFPRPPAR
jgi:hypothetical protein